MNNPAAGMPHLSVIMPCFNVADTLDRAMQSIMMQKVNFEYEIIAVDDASTDTTLEQLEGYVRKGLPLRVIRHEQNQGNAVSFYDALCAAQGDYFCVLDGDDYYTLPDKYQKQVDFLDADVKQRYVGCCHYFVIDTENGNVSVPDCMAFDEFNYTDFITQRAGYFHTTTHMYRHIFRGNVPELYRQKIYRGDTPRTIFHMMFSGGKIKILPFVASAYSYNCKGIWSSLDQKKQFEYQVNYLNHLDQTVTSPTEHAYVDKLRRQNIDKAAKAADALRQYPEKSIEQCLARAHRYAQNYAYREKEYFLQHVYGSEYLDTLCATLGVVHRKNHPELIQREATPRHLMIMIWQLNPCGGGLFREVEELLTIYEGWKITVVATDKTCDISGVRESWADRTDVEVTKIPEDCGDHLTWLSLLMCRFQPEKIYDYCSHVDVFGSAALQPGVAKNVCLFSYDHGFLSGLKNPFLDLIVAKRPVDYTLLTHNFGSERVAYIPTWNMVKPIEDIEYEPFKEHNKLITASGAARIYKLDGGWPYRYVDFVVALLKATGGIHYHFGSIPPEKKQEIYTMLDAQGVARERFVQIDWEKNLPRACLEKHVDVFIEPFPTVSYKMTLDMMDAGIPVIAMSAVKRMEKTDFLYDGAMLWRSQEEFIDILTHVTAGQLSEQSVKAKEYFRANHSFEVIKPCILSDSSLYIPEKAYIVDPNILDVRDQERLFMDCSRIQIMSDEPIRINSASKTLMEQRQNQKGGAVKPGTAAAKPKTTAEQMYQQAEAYRRTKTYRLGYAVMYLPRAGKLFFKELPEKGAQEALRIASHPDALSTRMSNPVVELDYVQHCTCMKVGRVLTAPFVLVKLLAKKIYWMLVRENELKKRLDEMNAKMRVLARDVAKTRIEMQASFGRMDAKRTESLGRMMAEMKPSFSELEAKQAEEMGKAMAELRSSFGKLEEIQMEGMGRMMAEMKPSFSGLEAKQAEEMGRAMAELRSSFGKLEEIQMEGMGRMMAEMKPSFSGLEAKQAEEMGGAMAELRSSFRELQGKQYFFERRMSELVWANVFHDTVKESTWLQNKSFSPGNYAVGYPFLYVMYRALDSMKPERILELGLGQTTRMIGQYTAYHAHAQHCVVEANRDWLEFFNDKLDLSERTKIQLLPYGMTEFRGMKDVRVFSGFKEAMADEIFDFICIDAPISENMEEYSRVDIFSLLPDHLDRRFVILLDDVNRKTETHTAEALDEELSRLGIPYQTKLYRGIKDMRIWCSPDLAFLCSL